MWYVAISLTGIISGLLFIEVEDLKEKNYKLKPIEPIATYLFLFLPTFKLLFSSWSLF